jgi:hypothetical protein
VDSWSAGCQVIPGMANWTEFITNAWTMPGDPVDTFLVDGTSVLSGPYTLSVGFHQIQGPASRVQTFME